MTAPTSAPKPKLIHIARLQSKGPEPMYLLLRKKDPSTYTWFELNGNGKEKETEVSAPSAEDAIRKAYRQWRNKGFRTINCGFRYTLPERDEHGINALFHQMAASYSSPTGIYFDEELGHNCIVHFASEEARTLWKQFSVL